VPISSTFTPSSRTCDHVTHCVHDRIPNKHGTLPLELVPADDTETRALFRKAQAEASISHADIANGEHSRDLTTLQHLKSRLTQTVMENLDLDLMMNNVEHLDWSNYSVLIIETFEYPLHLRHFKPLGNPHHSTSFEGFP